jgi:formylmethanofuran dehydrogenase subunit E
MGKVLLLGDKVINRQEKENRRFPSAATPGLVAGITSGQVGTWRQSVAVRNDSVVYVFIIEMNSCQ